MLERDFSLKYVSLNLLCCSVRFFFHSDRKICADANVCLNMWEPDKIRARCRKLIILVAILPFLFNTFIHRHLPQKTSFVCIKS